MSENQEQSEYIIGGMAVKCSILTQEQYEKSYYDHVNNPDVPYRDFLITQNYMTEEQMQYVEKMVAEYYRRKTSSSEEGSAPQEESPQIEQSEDEALQIEQPEDEAPQIEQPEDEAFVPDPDDIETVDGPGMGGGPAVSEDEVDADMGSADDGDLLAGFDDGGMKEEVASDTGGSPGLDIEIDSGEDESAALEAPIEDVGAPLPPEEEPSVPESPAEDTGAPLPPEEELSVPESPDEDMGAPLPPEEEPSASEPPAEDTAVPRPPTEEEDASLDTDTPVGLEAIQEKDEEIDFDAGPAAAAPSVPGEKGESGTAQLVLKNWQKRESAEGIPCTAAVSAGITDLALPSDIIITLGLEQIGEIEVSMLDGGTRTCRIFGMVEVEMQRKTCQVRAIELPTGTKPLLGAVPLLYLQ